MLSSFPVLANLFIFMDNFGNFGNISNFNDSPIDQAVLVFVTVLAIPYSFGSNRILTNFGDSGNFLCDLSTFYPLLFFLSVILFFGNSPLLQVNLTILAIFARIIHIHGHLFRFLCKFGGYFFASQDFNAFFVCALLSFMKNLRRKGGTFFISQNLSSILEPNTL